MGDLVEPGLVEAAMLAAPRAGPQGSAAPASAAPAGRGDRRRSGRRAWRSAARPSWSRLRTSLQDLGALEHAERLGDLEGDAAGEAGQLGDVLELHAAGPSRRTMWALSQARQPRLDLVARGPGELLVGEDAEARLEDLVARLELGDRLAHPADRAVVATGRGVVSAAAEKRSARASISPASALPAALRSVFASAGPPAGSGTKWKPCRWPTCWPSTVTSPVAVISASSIAFSLKRRISTLVRRSTKRWASRSCSASDSLSST